MLSTIGKAAIRRVGAGAGASHSRRVAQCTWQLQRLSVSQNSAQTESSHNLQFSLPHGRSYVTATKTVTKPRAKKAATTTKKPAAKKVAAKKPAAKKPKKKKVVAKKKPIKKVLTEEQLARRKEKEDKTKIKELKALALLDEPKSLPSTAWRIVFGEGVPAQIAAAGETDLKAASAQLVQKYKNLSASEREVWD